MYFNFLYLIEILHFNNTSSSLVKEYMVVVSSKFFIYYQCFELRNPTSSFFIIFVPYKILRTFFCIRKITRHQYLHLLQKLHFQKQFLSVSQQCQTSYVFCLYHFIPRKQISYEQGVYIQYIRSSRYKQLNILLLAAYIFSESNDPFLVIIIIIIIIIITTIINIKTAPST